MWWCRLPPCQNPRSLSSTSPPNQEEVSTLLFLFFTFWFLCLLALHLLKVEPGGLNNQVELRIMFPISHHPGLLVLPLSGAGVKRRLELAHDFSFDLRAADESVKASGSYDISRKSCSLHLFITETIRQEQGCHWLWKKSRNGHTLGPVELIVRPEQGNQGDDGDDGDQGDWRWQDGQVEVSIIIFGMSESSGFQKYT